ncbi:MAG: hypothetical protein ACYST0_11235, partial [Planctomycetota bacterium]
MQRLLWLIPTVALSTTLLAQSVVSPKGFGAVEGAGFAHIFGRYAEGRFQFAEGDLRGTSRSIVSVLYRLDHRNHTTDTAMGRKWTTVTLKAGETNYALVNQLWNRNALTTPTQVFSGTMHWLSQTGLPLLKPTVWGGLQKDLAFPFSSPFQFGGKNDLLLDYEFKGGTLDNSAAWNFTDARFYYLDSESISTKPRSGVTTSYPAAGACADSSQPQSPGAASTIAAITYADTDPSQYKGSLRVYHETKFTAPSALVLQTFGLSGLSFGLPLGARCNKLYVNTGQPWIPIYRVTDQKGASARSEYVAPWLPLYAGLQLWTQGAWTDSTTRAFSLTRAAMVVVPAGKPPPATPRKKV